jgi:hypothetical protein
MKQNSIIIVLIIILGISIYLNYANKSLLKGSQSMNDILSKQVETMYSAQRKQVTADSLKYVIAIDSLENKIKVVQIKRKNDLTKLQSQISKINNITDSTGFNRFNDSIKMCCTNNHSN